LIVHPFARTMRQFAVAASLLGAAAAALGFGVAYRNDLPVGPTDMTLLGALYLLTFIGRKAWTVARNRAPA
jgi:ABC-type Mn2+/Zn2+ transport system permease subunit